MLFSVLDGKHVRTNTDLMLHKIPEFEFYYVAYLKDDPAKNRSLQATVRRERSPRQHMADFELREISREEYDRLRSLLQI